MKRTGIILILAFCLSLFLCACSSGNGEVLEVIGTGTGDIDTAEYFSNYQNENPSAEDGVTLIEPTGEAAYYIAKQDYSGLYGIYDTDNKCWSFEPCCWSISSFDSAGMALALKDGSSDDYYGFIDQTGQVVIGFQFKDAGGFRENGYSWVIIEKVGVIDREGNFVINPEFEEVSLLDDYIQVGKHGSNAYSTGLGYGLYDYDGNLIIDVSYNGEFVFENGYIYAEGYTGEYTVFDYDGNNLIEQLPISKLGTVEYVCLPKNGIHRVYYEMENVYNSHGDYRIADLNFNVISRDLFYELTDFSSAGYAAAIPTTVYQGSYYGFERTLEDHGQWCVINTSGDKVLDLPEESEHTGYSYDYEYVNSFCAVGEDFDYFYTYNLATGTMSKWREVIWYDEVGCLVTNDLDTRLWNLYGSDGQIIDSNCSSITYEDGVFYLEHGGETGTYIPETAP